jgi:endonuclease YncB( thermonuclease family)
VVSIVKPGKQIAAAIGMLLFAASAARADGLVGVPRIIDGDTVEIGATKVRLEGIDAPEMDQFCLDNKSRPAECGKGVRDALV